jgi:hypothetical protein
VDVEVGSSLFSAPVRTDGFGMDGVEAAAGGHEEAITAWAAEADIGADFG